MAESWVKGKRPRRAVRKAVPNLSLLDSQVQKPLLALQEAMDSRSFLKAAEQLIHAVIPCDVVYTLLHYSADRGRSMVAWGSNGDRFTNEYVQASLVGNPLNRVLATKPGVKAFPLCDCYPDTAAMERDPFFIKFIQGIGIYHACVMIFWREGLDGADLVIGPHRSAAWPKFSREEISAMETIHPHIDAAYRRVNKLQSQGCARKGMEEFLSLLPLPAVMLDWELNPIFHNAAAIERAARWSGAGRHEKTAVGSLELPADILAAVEEMRVDWTNALLSSSGPTIFLQRTMEHSHMEGFRAEISMSPLRSPHFGKPSFVIRFESDQRETGAKLATLTRLTPREQSLALMVSEGMSNQEIADKLGRTLSTIKSELYVVYKKLGIPSRTRLVTLLR